MRPPKEPCPCGSGRSFRDCCLVMSATPACPYCRGPAHVTIDTSNPDHPALLWECNGCGRNGLFRHGRCLKFDEPAEGEGKAR